MDNEEALPLNLARRMILTWLRQRNRKHLEQDPEAREILDILKMDVVVGPGAPKLPVASIDLVLQKLSMEVCPVEKRLLENLTRIRGMLDLNETEVRILAFFCVKATVPEFEQFCSKAQPHRLRILSRFVSGCLGRPPREIIDLLSVRGRLRKSGLFGRCDGPLMQEYGIPDSELAWLLIDEPFDPRMISGSLGSVGSPPTLSMSDYRHVRRVLDLLLPHLRMALSTRRRGVNVLVHGPAGTGKTELARVLGKTLRCGTFEPAYFDSDGDPIKPQRRLINLRCALTFLSNDRTLMVCDEMDDLFLSSLTEAAPAKLWINRLLETNEVPIIWLSNSIEGIDPAILRRFDFVFDLPIPPRGQRRKILHRAAGSLVSPGMIRSLAEWSNLAPAVATRAADVLAGIGSEMSASQRDHAFNLLVSNSLKAQGLTPPSDPFLPRASGFDPATCNASVNLPGLVAGLRAHSDGRLCLHGPPGTGKSAFGRWLADSLGKPLHAHRLSDLLSMYVGGTEKRMCDAFRTAANEGAVLLLDEVDALVADRNGAVRTWEVMQVTEMLTQMEDYTGILVATTNRHEFLDPASRRRFDLEVGFGYLAPPQLELLFQRHCADLGWKVRAGPRSIRSIPNATPGDFAAVRRRHRFQPLTSPADLAQAVVDCCARKPAEGNQRVIGFETC